MALGFLKKLVDRFSGRPVDWDELEEALIRSDIGVPMTLKIVQESHLRSDRNRKKIWDGRIQPL
jgi:signal recognition particle GTPase